MATITTTIDAAHGLTVRTVIGTATAEEITGTIDSYYAGPVTRLVLWDFTGADVSQITASQVREFVMLVKQYETLRAGGKTAIAAPSDLGFGLTRMYEIQLELESSSLSRGSFRTKAEALEWLLRPEPSAL